MIAIGEMPDSEKKALEKLARDCINIAQEAWGYRGEDSASAAGKVISIGRIASTLLEYELDIRQKKEN
jgi:hypothetical protein